MSMTREKSSLERFDKLPSLGKGLRPQFTPVALCAFNHCQNTHTILTIKLIFLPDTNSSEY